MRKLFYTSVVFLLISFTSTAQWIQQNSGTTNRFLTCFFLNENIGWAAGDLGTIVKTTDSGQNWTSQSISTSDNVHSIFFTDPLNGWLVLYEFVPDRHGSIMHTTNGGDSWFTQLTIWDFSLHRIFFTDSNNGYAMGSNGILFKTANGGQSWNDISPFNSYWLYSAFFFNPNVGWLGGGLEGYLLRTINGGQSWSYIGLPTNERMMSLFFINENYGWACGANGKILRTTNFGLDWLAGNSGVTVELRDIKFIDQNEGWSVGLNGRIIHTTNGGISWIQQNSYTSYSLFGIYFADALTGWAVGENGIILKTNNGGVPVELISFSASFIEAGVLLTWTTATELNNRGFEIERCAEYRDWRTIGFIEGKGTTSEIQQYSFTDDLFVVNSERLFYRLKQVDYNGQFEYSSEVEVNIPPSGINLSQNYPNPFNPNTKILYSIPEVSFIKLSVYNSLGEKIADLEEEEKPAGYYEVNFDGNALPSGIYFYTLSTGKSTITKNMILLK